MISQDLRFRYYRSSEKVHRLRKAGWPFAKMALWELMRRFGGPMRPVAGETARRLDAAVDWICRAQDATEDGGVSYGFFPGWDGNAWRPSYPETTGYIIYTMSRCANRLGRNDLLERAVRMAEWEIEIQMDSGAVQGGILCPRSDQTPAEFNTGMVLQGWTEAWRATCRPQFLEAGRRAADFLLSIQEPDGSYPNLSKFVAQHAKKNYNVLCSWAVYRFGEDTGDIKYRHAAVRNVEAVIQDQLPNGWIANNSLDDPQAPLTHTIGYALQGILEVGVLASREDFVSRARLGADAILPAISDEGYLPGRFRSDWSAASLSSCLTGQAQIAVVLYRLFELTGEAKYRKAGDRLVNFLKATQRLSAPLEGCVGAVPGSWPLTGDYVPLGYPNWATKYFIDALLYQLNYESLHHND